VSAVRSTVGPGGSGRKPAGKRFYLRFDVERKPVVCLVVLELLAQINVEVAFDWLMFVVKSWRGPY